MKKSILLIIIQIQLVSSYAQIKSAIFVGGVGPDKLALTGGLEFASKAKNKTAFFIRPSYSPALFRNDIVPVKYIDVPFGLKFILADENGRGSGASYSIDFNVGPYVGYAVSGKYPVAAFTEKEITFGKGTNAQMDGLDYGLFLNTQIALGQTFGFGVSTQFEIMEHDLSKLGTAATTVKEKARKQSQITLFFNIGKRKK
jgi:hypothetical protein